MQELVLLEPSLAEGILQSVVPLRFQVAPGLDRRRVSAAGQELKLLIDGVGRPEDGTKLVRAGIKVTQLPELGPQTVGLLRVPQEVFLKLTRRQDAGQIVARLLTHFGNLDRIRFLALGLLTGNVGFDALVGPGADALECLFHLGGKSAENRTVQYDTRA